MTELAGQSLRGRWRDGQVELLEPSIDVSDQTDRRVALSGRVSLHGGVGHLIQRGPEGASGAFAMLVWDVRGRSGSLFRDQLGSRDVFYARVAGGLAFADEVAPLLELLPVTPGPDEEVVSAWLGSGVVPVGRTLYAGVSRLPPGHRLPLDGSFLPVPWWRLEARTPVGVARAELAESVLRRARTAVVRADTGEGRPGVLVSGGLDSATVLALLAEQREADGRDPPVAYSAVFPTYPEMDESELIDLLIASSGSASVRTSIRGGSALGGSLDYLSRWRLPSASPNHFLWRDLLARAAADGRRVMIDGEGGDEVFGMQPWYIADLLSEGRLHAAQRLAGRIPGLGRRGASRLMRLRMLARFGPTGLAPHGVHRMLAGTRRTARRSPALLGRRARRQWSSAYDPWAWKRLSGPLWQRRLTYALTDEREILDAHGHLRRRAAGAGLESRHPFMHDVDLLQSALDIPPEALFNAWMDRPLLREGLVGRLPDPIRLRRGKSYFTPILQDSVSGPDRGLLITLLRRPDAEARRWLNPTWLEEDVALQTGRQPAASALQLFRAGALECWLRSLSDPTWPAREVAPLATPTSQEVRAIAPVRPGR